MSLEKNEFKTLVASMDEGVYTQRALADASGLSLGTVNRLCQTLRDRGLMDGFYVTAEGYRALQPYKVENAIIMAAGLSSRFAPLSYEKPKACVNVRGEVADRAADPPAQSRRYRRHHGGGRLYEGSVLLS